MSLDCKILEHIENIEQDFRMLDNIFKCMNMYWKGDGADAIINTYQNIKTKIISAICNSLTYSPQEKKFYTLQI